MIHLDELLCKFKFQRAEIYQHWWALGQRAFANERRFMTRMHGVLQG